MSGGRGWGTKRSFLPESGRVLSPRAHICRSYPEGAGFIQVTGQFSGWPCRSLANLATLPHDSNYLINFFGEQTLQRDEKGTYLMRGSRPSLLLLLLLLFMLSQLYGGPCSPPQGPGAGGGQPDILLLWLKTERDETTLLKFT